MSTITERRDNVYNWIIKKIYDVERLLAYGEEDHGMYFEDENEFKQMQRQFIDRYDDVSIQTLEFLMKMCGEVGMMDCENMLVWDAYGFIFNRNGRIIIHHER